jgi:hypothetical protein
MTMIDLPAIRKSLQVCPKELGMRRSGVVKREAARDIERKGI